VLRWAWPISSQNDQEASVAAPNDRLTPKAALERHPHLRLKAGLRKEEISNLSSRLPGLLPVESEELLTYAAGFSSSDLGPVDFTGRSVRFSFVEVSPFGIPVASRHGNSWVIDLDRNGTWSSVLYFSHDPPVVLIQFDSLTQFINALGDHQNVTEAANHAAAEIYKASSLGMTVAAARQSKDKKLATFASNLPQTFSVFDLREGSLPKGFAWGRGGADSECRRAGTELIFAATTA
jgi:hypothetical protein